MTVYSTYSEIREFRDQYISNVPKDHVQLNYFHDCIMMEVVKLQSAA